MNDPNVTNEPRDMDDAKNIIDGLEMRCAELELDIEGLSKKLRVQRPHSQNSIEARSKGKSWVITASVYVDNAETPEEAKEVIERANESEAMLADLAVHPFRRVFIRLPDDEPQGYKWEESGQEVPG